MAEFRGDKFGRVGVDDVVHRRHHATLHQNFDDIDAAPRHSVGELGDRYGFGDNDFAGPCRSRGLLLAMSAVQLAAERGQRTHAFFVVRQRTRDGQFARAPSAWGRFAGCRRLRRGFALFRADLIVFFGKLASAFARRRRLHRSRRRIGGCFLLFEAARSFLLGATAGLFFGVFARFLFGFALFRGVPFAADAIFFKGAAAGFFLSVLARFLFGEFGVGQRAQPRFFFILGKFAQHDT